MAPGQIGYFDPAKVRRFLEVGYLVPTDDGVPMPDELRPQSKRGGGVE
jgi:hypothetical protein